MTQQNSATAFIEIVSFKKTGLPVEACRYYYAPKELRSTGPDAFYEALCEVESPG